MKRVNLALQGGGAHGAYTWGVLDRLLEDDRIDIEGISGTSAGAMNGAVLVDGYMRDGKHGARAALESFWREISHHANPLQTWVFGLSWNLDDSPLYTAYDVMSRVLSPYQTNPLGYNPLRSILEDVLDIERVNSCSVIRLFVSATRVRDGKPRIFRCDEISIDALLASACLPLMFPAVEIDGEEYWDGGFVGNPSIWPLIYYCQSEDVFLVQINPVERGEFPRRASEIINRMNEITFNASLVAEMRAIRFVTHLIDSGHLDENHYKKMRIHLVERPSQMLELNASSKLNADWDFFVHLKALGRQAMGEWLDCNFEMIGEASSELALDQLLRGGGVGR